MRYADREDAAHRLIKKLEGFRSERPLILAIPRGSVPMARIVADELNTDLDLILVRKIGAPSNPEFAIGAVSEDGEIYRTRSIDLYNISSQYVEEEAIKQLEKIRARRELYTPYRASLNPQGRIVIVVDDGLATGATMLAALRTLRARYPKKIIVASPVASSSAAALIEPECDQTIFLETSESLFSISQFYNQFPQVSDEEVIAALSAPAQSKPLPVSKEIFISDGRITLSGHLKLPTHYEGIVLFAHGSGSSRLSPRNQHVASRLQEQNLGTLLFDLLTEEESHEHETVFDIPFLASRLRLAVQQLAAQEAIEDYPLGFFGASTGAAAALWAAADLKEQIAAVVSRGGRPDLASSRLRNVTAKTLLIVGEHDETVLELNKKALTALRWAELIVVPGATHLFSETGALDAVATHAAHWFKKQFANSEKHIRRISNEKKAA